MCWLLGAAAAAGADPSKRRLWHHATGGRQRLLLLLCPQRHGPPGRGNTMALKDEQGPKYAFPGAGTSLLKSPIEKACYTFLDAGYWELLLLVLTLQKGGFRQGNPMLLKGDSDCCCCCANKDTALPDGETPWPWRTNRVQNMCVPGPERPFWNLLQKACYTFLEAGCWLAASCFTAAVALTAAFACVCCCLLMPAAACCCLRLPAAACCLLLPAASCCCLLLVLLLVAAAAAVVLLLCCCNQTASKARNSYCCCCCAHKDTALLDGETPWPWRTNGVRNRRFGAGTSFLKSPRKSLLYVSRCWLLAAAAAAGAADPSKRRLPARKPHATEGWQRLLLLLLCPQRHGPPGRGNTMALKDELTNRVQNMRVRGPERPFWNLLQKACYTFLAAGSLLAAALLPLRLLLRLLVSAAAYWCLLLPAAACGCLLPAAPCCCQTTGSASLKHHGSEGQRSHISSKLPPSRPPKHGICQPQTPWKWETKKPRNGAEQLPNVSSEILEN